MGAAAQPVSWSLLYVLDACAIGHFLISYYRKCYRRGYRIDFWHAQLFLSCVLPNMIMLPFAGNEANVLVLGKDLGAVRAVLPMVFLVTLLGYGAILAGGGLWRLRLGAGLRKTFAAVLDVVPKCSLMLMSSRGVLLFQAGLCLLMQAMILGLYFSQSGFGLDLRGYTFENPTLRPIALVISNYSIIVGSHCLARYVDKKERILLASTLLLTIGLAFFGARSNLVSIYIAVLLCYLVRRRNTIGLFRLGSLIILIVGFGLYLGNARAGLYSIGEFITSLAFLVLYGNTFSDLRDFAWVYSAWDHVFWAGKSYLAAILAFVPRFASSFRDTWSLGAATAATVGFDPELHPGLRPGIFGEGFFNFGLLGVVGVGVVFGLLLGRVDSEVKRAFASPQSSIPQPSMMKAFASTMLLEVAGCVAVSAGFSSLYVLAGVYLFTWLCICVQRIYYRYPLTKLPA